jgi:hypothetical protein
MDLTPPAQYSNPCNFVWDGLNGEDTSDGTILILTFVVPEEAEIGAIYEINVSYTEENIVNGAFEYVEIALEAGSITIDSLLGDVNDDGVVDVADVITLRRYMAGGYGVTINEEQSDINQDGLITIADLLQLRRYIVSQ